MEFAWVVDALVGVLVIVSAYLAMVRGLVRELLALASWVVAFFAAFFFAPTVQPMLGDIPGIGSTLSDCQVGMLVAFILVFGVALIITGIVVWLVSGPTRNSAASVLDQGLGFIYGALRGLVLVAVIFIAYEEIVPDTDRFAFVNEAFSIGVVREVAEIITGLVPEDMPAWLSGRVDQMMGVCPDAN